MNEYIIGYETTVAGKGYWWVMADNAQEAAQKYKDQFPIAWEHSVIIHVARVEKVNFGDLK